MCFLEVQAKKRKINAYSMCNKKRCTTTLERAAWYVTSEKNTSTSVYASWCTPVWWSYPGSNEPKKSQKAVARVLERGISVQCLFDVLEWRPWGGGLVVFICARCTQAMICGSLKVRILFIFAMGKINYGKTCHYADFISHKGSFASTEWQKLCRRNYLIMGGTCCCTNEILSLHWAGSKVQTRGRWEYDDFQRV